MSLWLALRGKEKLTGWHLLTIGALALFMLVVSGWSVAYTSNSEFCGTCHEMTPLHQSWQTSSHRNVACYDCHAEPGFKGTVKAKAKGMKELYLHMTSSNFTLKADERNINCYSCHQDKVKMNAPKALAAKDPHTVKHYDNGMTCMSCHSGLVHNVKLNNSLPGRDNCATCHLDAMKK